MPNRIIKDSINESRGLSAVSPFAQDFYKRVITYADDYGRFNADTDLILARLYPREITAVAQDDISDAIIELVGVGKIRLYTAPATQCQWLGSVTYGYLPSWNEHQRVRDSKKKAPDPESEAVNDVYLRRFIPVDLKRAVFERDKFKCQHCGKDFSLAGIPTARAVRLLGGVLHVDHIVPVNQGGRATAENLRLLCASCNLSRPRTVSIEDLQQVPAACENSPQLAADLREPPPNPIQSNPNPIQSSSDKSDMPPGFASFWNAWPNTQRKTAKTECLKKWRSRKLEAHTDKILAHVVAMKATETWRTGFEPAPLTYINQSRWEDGLPPPDQKAVTVDLGPKVKEFPRATR